MERKCEREDITCDQRTCSRKLALGKDANDKNKQWKWEVFHLERILEVWNNRRVYYLESEVGKMEQKVFKEMSNLKRN